MQTIQYRVTPTKPGAHIFQVECLVRTPDPGGQRFRLPAWIAGSYVVRDFAGDVVRVAASSKGARVKVHKLDKHTWECESVADALTLHYEVYAWDGSVRTAYLDGVRGFFNGTSLFVCPEGCEQSPCELILMQPGHPDCRDWRVATAMHKEEVDARGFGVYRAESYEELIDHPVEMGNFSVIPFRVCGADHELVLSGRCEASSDRLAVDLTSLCTSHASLFGDDQPPMHHYQFLTRVVGSGYGGLEHRASASLICSRDALPRSTDGEPDEKYRTFLGLCSHEYFHVWNVKRIRPEAIANADRGREAYTEDLWAYEGITAYYDHLMLARAGLITPEQYLSHLSRAATRLWRTPARKKQSLAESSYDAWIKFYKQGSDAPNNVVSYYNKGALVALCLDLKLRRETGGKVSLDDVMRALWNAYGKPDIPVPERGIETLAEEVSGVALGAFFETMLRGHDDPPLETLLPEFGVDCALQTAHASDPSLPPIFVGLMARSEQGRTIIAHVLDDSPAQQAGLAAGDELIACNRLRVDGAGLDGHVNRISVGEPITLDVFRRDEFMRFQVEPAEQPRDTWTFTLHCDVSEAKLERRNNWLWRTGDTARSISGKRG